MWISKNKLRELENKIQSLEFAVKNPAVKKVGEKIKQGKQKFIVTKVELIPAVTDFIFGISFTRAVPHWLYTCIDVVTGLEYQLNEIKKINKKA